MHVMDIPNLAERLSCVLFMRNFGASVAQIRHHLGLMASAAKEVRESADFKLLLQFVLAVGNFMNSGTAKGAAQVRPRYSLLHLYITSKVSCFEHLFSSPVFRERLLAHGM
jgi:Formin Homology 2 Domain